jgi:Tfp pilus assembly pilus retraction ATPase PilT
MGQCKACQTGHLVFGTLHATSAVRTLELVLGMYPLQEQEGLRRALAETLLGVISQGLIKTTDGKRAAFHDIFINNETCRDYIMRGELDEIEAIMNRSAFDHMQTANQALARLVQGDRFGKPGSHRIGSLAVVEKLGLGLPLGGGDAGTRLDRGLGHCSGSSRNLNAV